MVIIPLHVKIQFIDLKQLDKNIHDIFHCNPSPLVRAKIPRMAKKCIALIIPDIQCQLVLINMVWPTSYELRYNKARVLTGTIFYHEYDRLVRSPGGCRQILSD